jgi:hypothetical protein
MTACVTELYSRHLALGEPVHSPEWWWRYTNPLEDLPDGFPCPPKPNAPGGFGLAAAIMELPDMDRRRAALDVLQFNLLRDAPRIGWNTEPLITAYEACLADGLQLTLTSNPKASPDRRHRATLTYTIDGNGDAWTTIRVEDREGEQTSVGGPWPSTCESRYFSQIARTLTWIDRTTVMVDPGIEFPGQSSAVRHAIHGQPQS